MIDKERRIISVVAGGAGFIGVNLCRKLIDTGRTIIVADNLSLGSKENITKYLGIRNLEFYKIDLSNKNDVKLFFDKCIKKYSHIDEIWHLAANSDIPAGVNDPEVDLKDTFLTTFRLLEAADTYKVKNFHFASSSAVYGNWNEKKLHESLGPLKPISNYGAMKLASEAQISAVAEERFDTANIFRFPNVVGVPATHGVILDFIKKIKSNAESLEVLGNGTQKKSYLHVNDLVSTMIHIADYKHKKNKVEIINIGCSDDGILVSDIAEIVRKITKSKKDISYGDTDRGWRGDVPRFSFDTSYLKSFGVPDFPSSREAVERAAIEIFKTLN